jgi:hypothetical protein
MRALQLLKSLGYSLRIVNDIINFESGIAFAENVSKLRASWFNRSGHEREEALFQVIQKACDVGRQALQTWFKMRPPELFAEPDRNAHPGLLSYFNGFVCSGGESGVTLQDGWINIGIPGPWFDHYRAYAAHESELGQLIRRSMVSDQVSPTRLTVDYSSYLETKLTVCAGNFRWVRRLGLDSGAFRFGFLLERAGWNDAKFDGFRGKINSLCC